MNELFYTASTIAVISTAMVVTKLNAVHALLYLIVSLLSVALVFFSLGAPFAAALEVIIYAGAIMVLFVFVIMMLTMGPNNSPQERGVLAPRVWIGPGFLASILVVELLSLFLRSPVPAAAGLPVEPKQVGISLFGPYMIGVELASLLLLSGIVGAYHLGRRDRGSKPNGRDRGERR